MMERSQKLIVSIDTCVGKELQYSSLMETQADS